MVSSRQEIYIADTDLLSALIKVECFHLLLSLFGVETIQITPAVLEEIHKSPSTALTDTVNALLSSKHLQVVVLTADEMQFGSSLPNTLGPGERQTIAFAKFHSGTVLSNESRVAHWCAHIGVKSLRLPAILRRLWQTDILSVDEVEAIIKLLQERDRMLFSAPVLAGIFDLSG